MVRRLTRQSPAGSVTVAVRALSGSAEYVEDGRLVQAKGRFCYLGLLLDQVGNEVVDDVMSNRRRMCLTSRRQTPLEYDCVVVERRRTNRVRFRKTHTRLRTLLAQTS